MSKIAMLGKTCCIVAATRGDASKMFWSTTPSSASARSRIEVKPCGEKTQKRCLRSAACVREEGPPSGVGRVVRRLGGHTAGAYLYCDERARVAGARILDHEVISFIRWQPLTRDVVEPSSTVREDDFESWRFFHIEVF